MIPERFCIDYPSRVLTLLERLSPEAEQLDLSTTFLLSLAMPMLVIPLERLKSGHLFSDANADSGPHRALQTLYSATFEHTPFWIEDDRERWRFAYVIRNLDSPCRWEDEHGSHPLRRPGPSQAASTRLDDIVLTMRNGMSHGTVVYLDEDGDESPHRRVTQIAFLSNVTGSAAEAVGALPRGARRLVAVEEDALRRFLYAWCQWLSSFSLSSTLRLAA
jgi:hypothetical protein